MLDERIDDGTLARTKSPVPSLLAPPHLSLDQSGMVADCAADDDASGLTLNVPPLRLSQFRAGLRASVGQQPQVPASASSVPGPVKVTTTMPTAHGKCAYLNPQDRGRVMVPAEVLGRLRQKGGMARIADARTIKKSEWAKPSEWPDLLAEEACYQEIIIDGQTIRVVRPTDAQLQGKNLPSVKQLAAALSAVPRHQRELTKTALIRANAKGGLRGLGGAGEIEIFPVDAEKGSNEEKVYRESPQTYFDILVMHECAHNYHGKFWSGAEDVADWQSYASADRSRPSPYAAESGGEDFCEFMVLYNAAAGTPCEKLLRSMYPNRWRRLQAYEAR